MFGMELMTLRNHNDDIKSKIFKNIQEFLKNPPVIIWGSGATVPEVSDSCIEELKDGRKYIFIEKEAADKTKVTIKNKDSQQEFHIDGNRWQFKHFMEVI
jgi:hypothetical protein